MTNSTIHSVSPSHAVKISEMCATLRQLHEAIDCTHMAWAEIHTARNALERAAWIIHDEMRATELVRRA